MSVFEHSLEEEIRRAIRSGTFDDLPGKGKPLNLKQNPHEDPTWRLAYHILRSSGHTLPWIEKRQTIELELEAARRALAYSWAWRESVDAQKLPIVVVEDSWEQALERFEAKIQELNKRIFDYNLEVPSNQLKRQILRVHQEIAKITGQAD